jgi:hypothetical protein
MLVFSATFPAREDLGSKLGLWRKTFAQNIGDEHVDILKFKRSFVVFLIFLIKKNILSIFQNKIIIQQ